MKFYVCALVAMLIKLLYEMHGATVNIGTGIVSPELKRPVCEVNHLPPSSAEAKNEWRYFSRYSSYLLHGDRISLRTASNYLQNYRL